MASTSTQTSSKLENLSKEGLVKYIKKQQGLLRQTKTKCEELSSQLKEKQDEVDFLEKEKTTWLSDHVQAEFEKKDEISAKNHELQMAAELGKQMLDRNDELQQQLDVLRQDHSKIIQELDRVTIERDTLKNEKENKNESSEQISVEENKQLLDKIKELQTEREETLETLENLKKERNKLKAICKELKNRMKVLESDVELMNKGKITPDEEQMRLLTKEKMELVSKIELLEEDREDIVKEFETLQEVKSNLEKDYETMRHQNEQANEDVDTLTIRLEESQKETQTLKEKLDNYNTDQDAIQSSYSNMKKENSELSTENEALKRQIDELTNMKVNWENDLSMIIEEKTRAVENSEILKTKVEKMKKEFAEKNQRNKELSAQLRSVNQEYSQLKAINENLKQKEDEFKLELSRETEKLKTEKEKFMKSCRALKASLEESKKALDQVTSECEEQKKTIENLQRDKKKMAQLLKKTKQESEGDGNSQISVELRNKLDMISSEKDALTITLKESQIENEKLNESYKLLQKQHECVVFEQDEANLTIKGLQEELEQHMAEGKKLGHVSKTLEEDKANLENTIKNMNSTLKEEREKMEDIFDNIKTELMSSMRSNETLKGELNELYSIKKKLETRQSELTQELNTFGETNKDLEKQLLFITGERNKVQHALSAVQKQWDEHQGNCEGSHEDLQERIKNLVAEKIEIEKICNDRVSELKLSEEEKQKLLLKITEIEKEGKEKTNELQEQLMAMEGEHEVIRSDTKLRKTSKEEYKNDMENTTQKLSAELSKVNEEKNNLDAEIDELFHAHDELQIKYDNEIKANQELNELIMEVSADKETLFKENKILSERLSEIQSNQLGAESDYYTQILGLQEMNDNLSREINELRSSLEKAEKEETAFTSMNEYNAEILNPDNKTQYEQIDILEKTIASLNSAKEDACLKLRETEDCLTVKAEELESEKNNRGILEEEIVELTRKIEFLESSKVTTESSNVTEGLDTITNNMNEISQLKEEIKRLKNECEQFSSHAQRIESQYQETRDQSILYKEKYDNMKLHEQEQCTEIRKLFELFCTESESEDVLEELKSLLTRQQEQNKLLTDQLHQRDKEICELEKTSESFSEELAEKKRQLADNEELFSKQGHDINNLNVVLESLNTKLIDKANECDAIKSQLCKEKEVLDNLEGKYRSLEDVLKQKNEEFGTAKVQMDEDLEKAKLESENKDTRIVQLEQVVSEHQRHREKLENKLNDLEEKLQQKQQIIDEKDSSDKVLSHENMVEEMKQLRNERDLLKEQLDTSNNEFSTLKTQFEKRTDELTEMLGNVKNKCCELEGEVKQKSDELGTCQETIKMMEREKNFKDEEIEEMTKLKQSVEKDCVNIKENENIVKEELVRKEEQLQSFAANENGLFEKINLYEKDLKVREKALNEMKQNMEEHVTENNKLRNEIQRLTEIVQSSEENRKMYQEKSVAYNKEIEEFKIFKADSEKKNKEREVKISKLKQVALKAKKETENIRKQFEDEKAALMKTIQDKEDMLLSKVGQDETKEKHEIEKQELQQNIAVLHDSVATLNDELEKSKQQMNDHQTEITRCREDYDALQEEKSQLHINYDTMLSENNNIQAQIKDHEETISSMKEAELLLKEENQEKQEQLDQISKNLANTEIELESERKKMGLVNKELENMKEKLDTAEKEAGKSSLVDLELTDCLKALETSQAKLTEKETVLKKKMDEIAELNEEIRENQEAAYLQEDKLKQAEEKSNKLTKMLVKVKKDLAQTKKQESVAEEEKDHLNEQLELKIRELENNKVDLSVLHAEKQNLEQQLLSVIESNKNNLESLNTKLVRVKSDCEAAKRSEEAVKIDYENYKTRVHSVLKQQKLKPTASVPEIDADERSRLQQNLIQLKIKLQEQSERLATLQSDYEDLESENEKLTSKHNQVTLDYERKETFWKEKVEQISLDYTANTEQYKETIKHLKMKNETFSNTYKEKVRKLEEEQLQTTKRLRDEITELERQKKMSKEKRNSRESPPLKLNLFQENTHLSTEERESGEGMDVTELEKADVTNSSSEPTALNPVSPIPLETLLSPSQEQVNFSSSNQARSPTNSLDLQEDLTKSHREIEHLSELLRDSEATSMRLTEQAKVLKDEIRRLERNQEREQGLSNLEYLKNIILKFLSEESSEKHQLIPVLTTMLKLSEQEKEFVTRFAGSDDSGSTTNASWSSYLYRWGSLN